MSRIRMNQWSKNILAVLILSISVLPLWRCGRTEVLEMQKQMEMLKTQVAKAESENAQLKEQVATLNNIVQEMSKLHELQQANQEAEAAKQAESAAKPKVQKKAVPAGP